MNPVNPKVVKDNNKCLLLFFANKFNVACFTVGSERNDFPRSLRDFSVKLELKSIHSILYRINQTSLLGPGDQRRLRYYTLCQSGVLLPLSSPGRSSSLGMGRMEEPLLVSRNWLQGTLALCLHHAVCRWLWHGEVAPSLLPALAFVPAHL